MMLGLMLNNCATVRVPVSSINTNIELSEEHYDILGEVDGSVTVLSIWMLQLTNPINYIRWGGFDGSYYSPAQSMAIYKAIEDYNIDSIIAPRFKANSFGLWPILAMTKVEVKGIGIRYNIKTAPKTKKQYLQKGQKIYR